MIATQNPTTCARYFNHLVNVFVDVVLNWDQDLCVSKPGHGLFGRTRAFFGATASQNSTGDLHCHMLIWVDEMPRTVDGYYEACKSPDFQNRVLAYVSSITEATYPATTESCPLCDQKQLVPVEISDEAFKKPRNGASRSATSKCASCNSVFGANEVIDGQMNHLATSNSIRDADWSFENIRHRIAHPDPLPLVPPEGQEVVCALRETAMLLRFQTHHWFHCRSCFKQTRRTPKADLCRMFFPKPVVTSTRWLPDDSVETERQIGCEYLNAYAPILAKTFKCNHDLKFLAAGEGPEKAFYMLKYATKGQSSLENPLTIYQHAFDKATSKRAPTDSAIAAGKRCIQSMCCALSKPQEIAAPLAALFIFRGSPFYTSTQFVKVFLSAFLNYIFTDEPSDVMLTCSGTTYRPTSAIFDYVYRPDEVETVCLMEFTRNWRKENNLTGLRFNQSHGYANSHSLHRRKVPVVATVIGKRLPDARSDNIPVEQQLRLHRALLTLFKPFRRCGAFPKDNCTSYFHQWWHSDAPDIAHKFLQFSNDYYTSREMARKRSDANMEQFKSMISLDASDDDYFDNDTNNWIFQKMEDHSAEDSIAVIPDDFFLPSPATKNISLLKKGLESSQLAAISNSCTFENGHPLLPQLSDEEWNARISKAEQTTSAPPCEQTMIQCSDNPTRVRMLLNIGDDDESWPIADTIHKPQEPHTNASLRLISTMFHLNSKQHKIFVRAGSKLLQSLIAANSDDVEQMIGFLGESPGSGKSLVIKALHALAKSWESQDSIETVAYQGVAAKAANGQTIHKLFQWGVNTNWSTKRYSIRQREKFARLKMLIMDEASTTDVKFIGMIDHALLDLKGKPDTVFGGIHVLFVGDWLQQLPVAGVPAFVDHPPQPTSNNNSNNNTATYFARMRGIEAYRRINEVVFLEENMRHRDDPKWAEILERWRFGEYTKEDIEYVNNQCYNANWKSATADIKAFCPIIVTSNTLRCEFNDQSAEIFCCQQSQVLHQFPATISRSRFEISRAEQYNLKHIRDDKTGNMAVLLNLAIGMPIQCTQNISRALELANGTLGHVVDFLPDPNDTTRTTTRTVQINDQNRDLNVCLHSKPPAIVLMKLLEFDTSHSIVEGLPPGIVPIQTREKTGITISLPDRSFSIKMLQAPIVPAFSLTSEKCQGLTVQKIIIGPLRHCTRNQPQRSSFYVAVTRVRTLAQMYLTEPLTIDSLKYFVPGTAVLQETQRLKNLERTCDARRQRSLDE